MPQRADWKLHKKKSHIRLSTVIVKPLLFYNVYLYRGDFLWDCIFTFLSLNFVDRYLGVVNWYQTYFKLSYDETLVPDYIDIKIIKLLLEIFIKENTLMYEFKS